MPNNAKRTESDEGAKTIVIEKEKQSDQGKSLNAVCKDKRTKTDEPVVSKAVTSEIEMIPVPATKMKNNTSDRVETVENPPMENRLVPVATVREQNSASHPAIPGSTESNPSHAAPSSESAGNEPDRLALSSWGLPDTVLQRYHDNGITRMFDWQAECLCTGNVLGEYFRLVSCYFNLLMTY